ncbi:Rqc2 family fibronectin-binding protein [Ammoniphilus resinae]|uniref:Rqc2 homolog RqcH n=1 Tax=Ammoniphilus resinae TaxID=861532 RepID=A0ABS4GKB8_9BACL|nr:NFACT RNA binding domain-containing protein [Ammoniphilus resinae]MBP1930713.1 putative ribosome quality control (RQC) complex YloA/Tae2 family protein [Ammoniphilus resinae]
MAFDGFVTKAIVDECDSLLKTGRISKIYQSTDSDILMQIRANGENRRLLISANFSFPRFHLTDYQWENPLEPPMFCMLLRKHCEGAIIEKISQVGMERIIHVDMRIRDELGDFNLRRLVVEIMGRHSNILLIDPEKNMILDGIHHVTPGVSRHRIVLPGRTYVAPPEQNKKNPLLVNKEEFIHSLDFNRGKIDKQLVEQFTGLSPLIAREIVHRAGLGGRDPLWSSFEQIMEQIRNGEYHPQIVKGDEKNVFSVVDLTHVSGETAAFSMISECIDRFYSGKAERDAVRQKALDLIRFTTNEIDKNKNKIQKLKDERSAALEADRYRLFGELLTAYMHQLKKGDTVAIVQNYYDEESQLMEIPMDPAKSPSENAQQYYKRYNKARTSLEFIEQQIGLANEEIKYFETIAQQLESASLSDLEEIREELVEGGYLRQRGRKNLKKKKNVKPVLDRYVSSEGIDLLVGKNNTQNEYLTNRLATSTDTWLHTKDIPGSHVVIRAREFSEQTLREAASLAAYFSKARGSNQIPVDYTLVKHVRKPAGAKPGFVIYDHQKTIFVNSDEGISQALGRK